MYVYNRYQWLLLFLIFSIFGWVWETVYCSIVERHLVSRGFLRGPIIPLYGFGGVLMVSIANLCDGNILLVYLVGVFAPSFLEYFTGVLMLKAFKIRYWDYSDKKFNIDGLICLSASLLWGVFTVAETQFVHPFLDRFILWVPMGFLRIFIEVCAVIGVIDVTLSVKAAIDLRIILEKMESAKHELLLMQKRLDVIIALADQAYTQKKVAIAAGAQARYDGIRDSVGDKLEFLTDLIKNNRVSEKSMDALRAARDEFLELRQRFGQIVGENRYRTSMKDFILRHLISDNPTMVAPEYKESLEELKEKARDFKKHPEE
ncbi:MAG: putative ABC transporter permease [Lachnospiraceae bacterium]|nr:putative ABC transporter permease [Lachnospiraceae bacterium]